MIEDLLEANIDPAIHRIFTRDTPIFDFEQAVNDQLSLRGAHEAYLRLISIRITMSTLKDLHKTTMAFHSCVYIRRGDHMTASPSPLHLHNFAPTDIVHQFQIYLVSVGYVINVHIGHEFALHGQWTITENSTFKEDPKRHRRQRLMALYTFVRQVMLTFPHGCSGSKIEDTYWTGSSDRARKAVRGAIKEYGAWIVKHESGGRADQELQALWKMLSPWL